jgi:hemerythrin
MQRFKWTKANAVFFPELDAEHRNIFHLGEELHSAVRSDAAQTHIVEILRALMAALEEHFSDEERRMRATRYPSFSWHKGQHDTLRRRIEQFIPQIEQGDREAALLMLDYLCGWLQDHTGLTDRMMCAYLRNHERQSASA